MALKDRFEKMISYFDTDDTDIPEEKVIIPEPVGDISEPPAPKPVGVTTDRPSFQQQPRSEVPKKMKQHRQAPDRRARFAEEASDGEQTRIALKFPRKYEDAEEIVDLLIENECVLIDFQYMLDAQARRCLDFIDGASKVLFGSLQKVGSSMYLLTPRNVVVDADALGNQSGNRDVSFDFDMKRR